MTGNRLVDEITGQSFLEDAFVRWVLAPAATAGIASRITAQYPVAVGDHTYRLDFLIDGSELRVAVELDGFAYHSNRQVFIYDRMRQNDIAACGYVVLRFSHYAIREETARSVSQLQAVLGKDPVLATYLINNPIVPVPDDMGSNAFLLSTPPAPRAPAQIDYFDLARQRLDVRPLRECQREAMVALANYYRRGDINAACVMSVGAGKTALGVAAALAFTRQRALIVTPGQVIRGTFATALDQTSAGNVLYTMRGGPLLPGCRAPKTAVLDRNERPINSVDRGTLLASEIILTNYHSLGDAAEGGLLAKLEPDDIDFIVIDEAHIAAADSYQRLFEHFPRARRLLMSACFSRADGRTVTADVVYRYRLIDAIADGHAKHLSIHRFTPQVEQTAYQITWPDGRREEIIGKAALLEIMHDERKLERITATSEEPIHRIMQIVRGCFDKQAANLAPVRPRILFAALGRRHAEQIARIANAYGISAATLHHTMSDTEIKTTRARYESASGRLSAIVQLRMLGQGYDLPAITVVVPMRPYGSFGDFYQFIGRGTRVIQHSALSGITQQLDVVYHGELGLDDHLETLRAENDMDPHPLDGDAFGDPPVPDSPDPERTGVDRPDRRPSSAPSAVVLSEQGESRQQFLHDLDRVEARREERELHALAQRYAAYAATTADPRPFEQFVAVIRNAHGRP